jgi:hypothetical protein
VKAGGYGTAGWAVGQPYLRFSIYVTVDDNQVATLSLTSAISTAWTSRLPEMLGLILAFGICLKLIEKVKGRRYPNELLYTTENIVGNKMPA